jgi:DNA-binding MarR family transcriptional regulator
MALGVLHNRHDRTASRFEYVYILVLVKTDCYCTSLRAATRKITAVYDAALAPVGVNVAQWGLLRKLGEVSQVPLSIQNLAEVAELERSTVARNIRVLEREGLVALGESVKDRRAATIVLTDQGLAVLDTGEPLWHSAQRQVEQLLGARPASELRALLLSL